MFSYFTVRSCLDYIDGIKEIKDDNDEESFFHYD